MHREPSSHPTDGLALKCERWIYKAFRSKIGESIVPGSDEELLKQDGKNKTEGEKLVIRTT